MITAGAHPNLQNTLWIQCESTLVRITLNVSVKELTVAEGVQGLPVGGVGRLDTAALKRAAEHHRDYVLSHLRVTAASIPLGGKITAVTSPPFFADPTQTFYQYEIEYPFIGTPPAQIELFHDMLKEWPYAAGTAWDVSYVVRPRHPEGNETSSWLLSFQHATSIPTGWEDRAPAPASASPVKPNAGTHYGWRTLGEYFRHGLLHILTGYDHLLFLAALVIATLSFWEMGKVIAAFTLAHTLTLALCVFGIFRLPSFIVEPVIALSIIFVALDNILRPQRTHSRARLGVAFGFGLIHGLGFAGGLLDAMAGLPSTGTWIALVAFSIGVEIGHQVIILPLFGLMAMSRQKLPHGLHPQTLRCASTLIGVCGVYYLVIALRQ